MNIREQLTRLNQMSQKSVALYHKAALSMGISDSALGVLHALLEAEAPRSQFELCGESFLPKQTVNSAVAFLQKKGFVSLSPLAGSRNKKSVALTEAGREFAEKTVGKLLDAELGALAALSYEERAAYIHLNERYNQALAERVDRLLAEADIRGLNEDGVPHKGDRDQ